MTPDALIAQFDAATTQAELRIAFRSAAGVIDAFTPEQKAAVAEAYRNACDRIGGA
jgi:hypothetical protein